MTAADRAQRTETAARILWDAAWPHQPWEQASEDDRGPHLDDAEAVVDALLPPVATVAEVDALPVGSILLDSAPEPTCWRVDETNLAGSHLLMPTCICGNSGMTAQRVVELFGPLTLVFRPRPQS